MIDLSHKKNPNIYTKAYTKYIKILFKAVKLNVTKQTALLY